MEPVHLEKQLELRQRQLREVAGTVKVIDKFYNPVSRVHHLICSWTASIV